MGTRVDSLLEERKRVLLVNDCIRLIDEEVDSKGGLSGFAIKTAYKAVKAVKSDFVETAVSHLLPSFLQKLTPFLCSWEESANREPLERFFSARKSAIADALLAVTDERAKKAYRGVVRSAYEKLRPAGKRNVEEAVPRMGRILEKHFD